MYILQTLGYDTNIADGYWHHIVASWTGNPGELTLYVDGAFKKQEVFGRGSTLSIT